MQARANEFLIEKWMNFEMVANASLKHASVQYSKVICLHTIDLLFNLIIYGLGTGETYISMDIKVAQGLLTLSLQNRSTIMTSYYTGIMHHITQNTEIYNLDKFCSASSIYSIV